MADNILKLFSEKTKLDISCELSTWQSNSQEMSRQTIHMKCQALLSLKKNNRSLVCCHTCHKLTLSICESGAKFVKFEKNQRDFSWRCISRVTSSFGRLNLLILKKYMSQGR